MRVAFALALTLAAPAAAALAQKGDDEATVRVTSRVVNVDVLVTDRRTGARVDGLKRENFQITDDGRPVEIKHFSQGPDPTRPLALLLLVNVRGTTKATVPRLRAALASALVRLRPEDEVAVFDYWYGHETVQELTRDRDKVLDALTALAARQGEEPRERPKGYGRRKSGVGEDLAASLLEAMRHARERLPNARVALVAIDDDVNAAQRKVVKETADQLLEGGATVSGLVKVSGAFATSLKSITRAMDSSHYPTFGSRSHESVAFYSRQTGGEVVNVDDDEFGEALERVVGNLAARYSIGFVPDASRLDGRFHRLKVKVEVPESLGKVGKLEVRARRGYVSRAERQGEGAPGQR
jgi:VWFA-related protein